MFELCGIFVVMYLFGCIGLKLDSWMNDGDGEENE
jgi:hypothetical protein